MSQCSRVLDVLRDGKPHSIQEIHERAGTMRLNSRISDLRKMGYFITYYRKDGLHIYKLLFGTVRTGEMADGDGQPSPARTALDIGCPPEHPSQTPSPQTDVTGGPHSRSLPREGHQLSVWEAA